MQSEAMKKKKEILNPREGDFACRNIAIEMPYPRTKPDVEGFLFYLYHGDAEVFIGCDGEWYLRVRGKCSQLTANGRCRIKNRQAEECLQHGHGIKTIKDAARFRFRDEYELLSYLREKRPALFRKLHPDTRKLADGPRLEQKAAPPAPKSAITGALDGEHECAECISCCTYINIIVENPKKAGDIDSFLWYIYHDRCEAYLDNDGDWSVLFRLSCANLNDWGLCGIYDRRPSICKKFSVKNCHGNDMAGTVRQSFKTERTLMRYLSIKRPGLLKKLRPELQRLGKI